MTDRNDILKTNIVVSKDVRLIYVIKIAMETFILSGKYPNLIVNY